MADIEVRLPAMGEGIIEATITKWLVGEGDRVMEDHPLVEIATDKVDSEIPSPASGIVSKIVYKEGEIPKVSEVIAIISVSSELGNEQEMDEPVIREAPVNTVPEPVHKAGMDPSLSGYNTEETSGEDFPVVQPEYNNISPFVRNLATQRGILYHELQMIKGTGKDNRVTRDDLISYILAGRPFRVRKSGIKGPQGITDNPENKESAVETTVAQSPGDADIIVMDRIRKIIAENMQKSKRTAPHVTSFAEADVTSMVQWRERIKNEFLARESVNLTYTALITEIVSKILREFPRINSSVDGDKILIKKEINIGIATALQNGNLIVPVIKNSDKESLPGLARKIHDLATRARQNKLQPAEIKGGTFTITNIGQYNSLTGTPIINLPEVAILAVGTIRKKPAVVTIPQGQGVGIRDIVMLSLTYDHRIIDGALGGEFLSRIVSRMENFDPERTL